jgi:hypothetical protein
LIGHRDGDLLSFPHCRGDIVESYAGTISEL